MLTKTQVAVRSLSTPKPMVSMDNLEVSTSVCRFLFAIVGNEGLLLWKTMLHSFQLDMILFFF